MCLQIAGPLWKPEEDWEKKKKRSSSKFEEREAFNEKAKKTYKVY